MNSPLAVKAIKSSKLPNDAAKFTLFGNNLEQHFETNGSILTDTRFSWFSVGPQVTIINNQNGSKKSVWRINNLMRDDISKVTCVSEIPSEWPGGDPLLAIGCEEGALYIYHSGASRILRTVQFNENVTSIELIDMGVRRNLMLPEELQLMNGVLAVGLSGGAIYLIDLGRNQLERSLQEGSTPRNEMVSQLLEIDLHNDCETDIKEKRNRALRSGDTLALLLNESALALVKFFSLPSRANATVKRLLREDVSVTCLKYFKEIACLAVGFNFSCIQLWHLPSFTLLYISPVMEEVVLPVVGFCLQEPSDDPQNVCYLWAVHQSSGVTSALPIANMYALNFDKKRCVRDYGSFYEDFKSCALRYELDLGDEVPEASDGRIISCCSVSKAVPRRLPQYLTDQEVEASVVSICAIGWEVWTPERYDVTTKLTLFDLNQWYKAQMPNTSLDEHISYMATLSLGTINQTGALLDVKISPNSVRQFIAVQPVDEHYYPASLSFECTCLTETEVYKCSWLGIQNESLNMLDSVGPSALLNPTRLFHNFISVGLRPSFYDPLDFSSLTTDNERQVLLSIMLEHGYTNFLKDCVRIWADGCQSVANCTLPALMRWSWSAVTLYKQMADNLCVHLFDYSGSKPDIKELAYCIRLLHTISDLFSYILKNYRNFILENNLESRSKALSLVVLYLDSVLWCVENKLLPEMHVDSSLPNGIPYNLQSLQFKINSRRSEANRLSKLLSFVPDGGLLLIDAFISNEAGGTRIIDQWEREGGGLYPPPSVQSILRVNLINGIPVHIKHCIMLYFLMDVINELPKRRENPCVNDVINKFAIVFKLSASYVNIIKGFWNIDNKHFEEGLEYLSNSRVFRSDLKQWQHRAILRSLFIQREPHLALKYLRIMSPPLCDPEDIKFELSLLLECELFLQAFEFQRRHKTFQQELLNNFFYGCMQKKQLGIVYKLSLNKFEEEAFTLFLENAQHPHSEDLRVLYLLSRARYVEAIDVNEKMRTKRVQNNIGASSASSPLRGSAMKQRNVAARHKAESRENIRDVIVSGFAKTLPPVTRELADYCLKHKTALASWKQVERPTPLSVVVHTDEGENKVPIYKGSSEMLMQSALMKTREIWAPLLATPAPSKSKFRSNVEDTPFLRSAVLSKSLRHSAEYDFMRTPGNEKKRERDELVNNQTSSKRFKFDEEVDSSINSTSFKEKSFNVASKTAVTAESIDEVDNPLLRTPHIKKKVVSVTPQRGTPQSILKSPWKGKGTPKGKYTPAKSSPLTFAKDVLVIEDKIPHVDAIERELPAWSSPMSRQIRFSLPKDDKDSSDNVVRSPTHASEITPRKRKSIRIENLNEMYDNDNSFDSFTNDKTSSNDKKEVYDIDDNFDDENDSAAESDKVNEVHSEEQNEEESIDENELPSDKDFDDKYISESDAETFATVSTRGSTTFSSDNKDRMSLESQQSAKVLSSVTYGSTDEYVSISEDCKDSTISDKSSSVVISSRLSGNEYENDHTEIQVSENDSVQDESHTVHDIEQDEKEVEEKKQNEAIPNLSSYSMKEDIDYNEINEDNDKLNSSVSSVTVENDVVKTYTSLKTVDDFSLNDEDEAALGEVLDEIDDNKTSESDADIKTISSENLEHEVRRESVDESELGDEQYEPEEKYNEDELEEEDDDPEEEDDDEDIYAGLDEDKENDENNEEKDDVSGSSDVIVLDSDSEGSDSKASDVKQDISHRKRYSEELDYDDYEREDFIEGEEELEEEDVAEEYYEDHQGRGSEYSVEEEFNRGEEDDEDDREEPSSSDQEEEDDDDDDSETGADDSEASESVKDVYLHKSSREKPADRDISKTEIESTDIEKQSKDNEVERVDVAEIEQFEAGKEDKNDNEHLQDKFEKVAEEKSKVLTEEVFIAELGSSASTKTQDKLVVPTIIEETEDTDNKDVVNDGDLNIAYKPENSKDFRGLESKEERDEDLDKSEDHDVINLQVTTTDIYDDSSLNVDPVGNLSIINEESLEIKSNESIINSNEKKYVEDIPGSSLSVIEDNHSVSNIIEKPNLDVIMEEPDNDGLNLESNLAVKSTGKVSRRRSKSVDDFVPEIVSSTSVRKSFSFTGAEQLFAVEEEVLETEEPKSKEDTCYSKEEIMYSGNEDPSTSKMSDLGRTASSKSSRSRRSSSVSQLSDLSSKYHSRRSSRRYGSTSSLLLDLTRSQSYSRDSTYGSSSKLDTSLGTFIKKLKKQNQNKPCVKQSSSGSYRSSIRKETSIKGALSLNVLSDSEDEIEGDKEQQENKIDKKRKTKDEPSKAFTSKGNIEDDYERQGNKINKKRKTNDGPVVPKAFTLKDSYEKHVFGSAVNSVKDVCKNMPPEEKQESFQFDNIDTTSLEPGTETVEGECSVIERVSGAAKVDEKCELRDRETTEVLENEYVKVNESHELIHEKDNVKSVNLPENDKTTCDMKLNETTVVEAESKMSESVAIAEDIIQEDGTVTGNDYDSISASSKDEIKNKTVDIEDNNISKKPDLSQVKEEDTLISENTDIDEVTIEETLKNQKRITRASSIFSRDNDKTASDKKLEKTFEAESVARESVTITEDKIQEDETVKGDNYTSVMPASSVDESNNKTIYIEDNNISKKSSSSEINEDTTEKTDFNDVTIEETLRNQKRRTRASSVVSDITPLVSDRSSIDNREQHGKLHRKKSISFYNVNDDKSTLSSRRYPSRRTRRSNILDMVKSVDSYRRSETLDPHKTRASSVSSIDESSSTVSYGERDSRRRSVRHSRFMDRSLLKQPQLQPLSLAVVSSDDETETISYTETLKKDSAFCGLIEKIAKTRSSPERKEKPSSNVNIAKSEFKPDNTISGEESAVGILKSSHDETVGVESPTKTPTLRTRKSKFSQETAKRIIKKKSPRLKQKNKILPEEATESIPHSPAESLDHSSPDITLSELISETKDSDLVEQPTSTGSSEVKSSSKKRRLTQTKSRIPSKLDVERLSAKDTDSDSSGVLPVSEKGKKAPKGKSSCKLKADIFSDATSSQQSFTLEAIPEGSDIDDQITSKNTESDSDVISNLDKTKELKHAKSKQINKQKSQKEHTVSSSQELLTVDNLLDKSPRNLRGHRRKSSSMVDVSKSTSMFEDADSGDEFGGSKFEASPTPNWKKVLRGSKLLDVPLHHESEDEEDTDEVLKKKNKPSPPEKRSSAKKRTPRKSVEREVGDEGSSSAPRKRKRNSVSATREKKRKSLLLSHDDIDEDIDRFSVCSEPVKSSVSKASKGKKSSKKLVHQQTGLYDIAEQPEENTTPKRNLRSSSILTDTGSADSRVSSKTISSDILPKRRSLFSTPKKTPDHDVSTIDDYTTQRRLTRHQKSLLEKSLDLSSVKE